jgi:hypothetical protein
MAYFCEDCSYHGIKLGECPACGSFNLVTGKKREEEEPPPAKWRLWLLIALWAYLIGMIIWKLIH